MRATLSDSSMFDSMNQMEQDEIRTGVAFSLFDDWNDSNLDNSVFYADWRIVGVYGDTALKKKFNEYYKLEQGYEYYFEEE